MKKLILLAGLFLVSIPLFSQNTVTERQVIENMIQLYFDGWATGDTLKLDKAMHASCHLKNYRDGKFVEFSKSQYLSLFKIHAHMRSATAQFCNLQKIFFTTMVIKLLTIINSKQGT